MTAPAVEVLESPTTVRAALRDMPGRIAADLDAASSKPWPETPQYEPDWPART